MGFGSCASRARTLASVGNVGQKNVEVDGRMAGQKFMTLSCECDMNCENYDDDDDDDDDDGH